MECNLGNGDRVTSPKRETCEVGGQNNHNTKSLVPFVPELSPGLRDKSQFWLEYL